MKDSKLVGLWPVHPSGVETTHGNFFKNTQFGAFFLQVQCGVSYNYHHSSDIHDPLIPPPATTSTTTTTTSSSNSNNNSSSNNNNSNNNNNNNNLPLQPGTSNQQPQPATASNQQPPRATTYVFVSARTSNTQWHHGNSTFQNPKFDSLKVLRKRWKTKSQRRCSMPCLPSGRLKSRKSLDPWMMTRRCSDLYSFVRTKDWDELTWWKGSWVMVSVAVAKVFFENFSNLDVEMTWNTLDIKWK